MSKPKADKKNTSLRLPAKTLKALKIRAAKEDASIQTIMEELIEAYLDGQIKLKPRKSK